MPTAEPPTYRKLGSEVRLTGGAVLLVSVLPCLRPLSECLCVTGEVCSMVEGLQATRAAAVLAALAAARCGALRSFSAGAVTSSLVLRGGLQLTFQTLAAWNPLDAPVFCQTCMAGWAPLPTRLPATKHAARLTHVWSSCRPFRIHNGPGFHRLIFYTCMCSRVHTTCTAVGKRGSHTPPGLSICWALPPLPLGCGRDGRLNRS